MHIPSFLWGWMLVIGCYLVLAASASGSRPAYAPRAPTYYICAALRADGYRVCTADSIVSTRQAQRVMYAWLRSQLFRQVRLVGTLAERDAWIRGGPRCLWQWGGNCA